MMKAHTGELEEATEAVELEIKQLKELVSKAIFSHLPHIHVLQSCTLFRRDLTT